MLRLEWRGKAVAKDVTSEGVLGAGVAFLLLLLMLGVSVPPPLAKPARAR